MKYDTADAAFLSPWIADSVNSYGYRVNIRNPIAGELYRRWRRNHGLPANMPMSDAERFAFELDVIPYLKKRFDSDPPAPNIPRRIRERLSVELLKRIYGVTDMEIVQDIKKEPPEEKRTAV